MAYRKKICCQWAFGTAFGEGAISAISAIASFYLYRSLNVKQG